MTAKVEISIEAVEDIVFQDLEIHYKQFKKDLESIGTSGWMFYEDSEKEKKEIKKYIKAFKRILGYYTVGGVYNDK